MVEQETKRLRASVDKDTFSEFKALCSLKSEKMEELAGKLISDYVKSELPRFFKEKGYGETTKHK
jgi:hypothetical protein